MMLKPVSQPCLRNQDAIYQVLKSVFDTPGEVLELAYGTAQHAVYFAERLAHLNWQPSDLADALLGAGLWINEAALKNLKPVIELNINDADWSHQQYDYIYSANLVHFVSQASVKSMFSGISKNLKSGGVLALYGPYNQNGFTSKGNASLDQWLKAEVNEEAGIKELNDIMHLANQYELEPTANHLMPANNHLLIFRKKAHHNKCQTSLV